MSAIDFVKEHPVAVGAGVLGVIVIVAIASQMGGGDGSTTPSTGSMDAGVQLQQMQSAQSAQSDATAAALQLGLAHEATLQQGNTLSSHSTDTANAIAGNVALANIDAQKYESTLAAQVQGQQIAAQLESTKEQYATIQYQANAQVQQTNAILQAQIEQSKPKGLFSFIFG